MTGIRALLLDLDGTLADTGPDMACALNALLREYGKDELSYAEIRPWVSHGGVALTRLGFDLDPDMPSFKAFHQRFLWHYAKNVCQETRLFDGMEQVLRYCELSGIDWGVVTNKPAFLTDPLIAKLGLSGRAACVVSGDTLEQRKPHPAPLLHGCQIIGTDPANTVYVGDAERDIQAGRSAGVQTLVAEFGYLRTTDDPYSWGADGVVADPPAILEWLRR
ncbi:MAG: HAD-IA family hydrolase [Gammaproteobacteria bacterium]|nr:HAD-IA family hydrolase [Gammaproteobacteria bacterium]